MRTLLASLALALALSGCRSYEIVQSNVFSNDDGDVIRVDYGRAEKDHVNTFRSPKNGETMEFKSRLVIEVTLPDGDSFTAWQCMNFTQSGTAYRSDNREWFVLMNGFTCRVYVADPIPSDPSRAREVFAGILCDSPETDYKPNEKWRKLKRQPNGKWK